MLLLRFSTTKSSGPTLPVDSDGPVTVEVALAEAVRTAMSYLHVQAADGYYRQQSWKLIRSVLASGLRLPGWELTGGANLDKWQTEMLKLLKTEIK